MIRQNFNADWMVEKGDGNSRMNSFLGNTQTKTVHLPYDAMIHEARTPDTKNGAQTGFYPGGEYIFQKHFTAPQAWQGKPVSLVFEGVYQTALVYLNGWLLTRNVNGYAEFTVEAGPYLKYGADNLLKVIADNSLEPNSRWYTGSGIYRPVRLLVGNKVYLPQDTVRITTREVDEGFARELLRGVAALGAKKVILTGVSFAPDKLGAMGYDSGAGTYFTCLGPRNPASFHGTGDIFAAVVTGGLMRGMTLEQAASLAVEFVLACIDATARDPQAGWYGVEFEKALPLLCERVRDLPEN